MSKKTPLESKELELMGLRKNEEEYSVFLSIKSEFKRMKKQMGCFGFLLGCFGL